MRKLILLCIIILSMTVSLVACRQDDLPGDTDNDETGDKVPGGTDEDVDEEYLNEVASYKEKAQSFDTEAFGEWKIDFSNNFDDPDFYPDSGVHPRVEFHASDIDAIWSNTKNINNRAIYSQYLSLSNRSVTGELKGVEGDNISSSFSVLAAIEAQAFRYVMTKDELYGYKAIYAIKNAILTADASATGDTYRGYGQVMYIAACVYDWCYDLLTEEDKAQIINGVINKLGVRMEVGAPPSKEGAIAHHTVECQILRNWLSFAIAVYDERPEIYDYVMGRLLYDIVPAQNYMMSSGMHWEGAYYGPFRATYLMDAQILTSAMSDKEIQLFDPVSLHNVCNTFIDYLLPGLGNDTARVFEIGDQAGSPVGSLSDYYSMSFFAGNYFGDPSLAAFASMRYEKGDNLVTYLDYTYISPTRYLIINDPDLNKSDYYEGRPLVNATEYPSTSIFSRSSWSDPNAVAVYMNAPEYFSSSHSHMDCGSFQIYYKGMLASDSGYYDGYGTKHHNAYCIQTVSSNSLLIYNHDLADSLGGQIKYYSGGQTLTDSSRRRCAKTLDEALASSSMNQSTVVGKSYSASDTEYKYSYLATDMTNAYDEETVDEVTRHMLSVMTGDEECPMVFVTFDRITSVDASYKKTYLLHSQVMPEITEDGYIIITNDKGSNGGKLIVQSLITDVDVNTFGGDGTEYTVNGTAHIPTNYNHNDPDYRIELSPKEAALTDYLLTVMYVTDANNDSSAVAAVEINTDNVAGAVIFNRVLAFTKYENEYDDTLEFEVCSEGEYEYYVAGVTDGHWKISVNGVVVDTLNVENGSGILTFTAEAGNVKLEKI